MRQLWLAVRSSFWFLPTLLVLASVILAVVLVESEHWLPSGLLEEWPRLFGSDAESARGLLTTIATTMITVAGVAFSSTLVALSLASSQYSSRVLHNFMRDKGTQSALGAFVGIFAYCLVVLRTIRGGDDVEYVPSLAVLGGLALGFVGIAVLIYFIHHIARVIQANHILAEVAADTIAAIENLYPERGGLENSFLESANSGATQNWYPVLADKTGYLQSADIDALLAFARKRHTVVRMERMVGQFVIEGVPVFSLLGTAVTDDDYSQLYWLYAVGRQRTVEQDAAFGIRQLVDVALRALSPGVNDTTTAVMCLHHLTAILVRLTDRKIECSFRAKDDKIRLLTPGPTYADLIADAFDQIRQNASANVAVLEVLLGSLELLASITTDMARRKVLLQHAQAVAELGYISVPDRQDRQRVGDKSSRLIATLSTSSLERATTGKGEHVTL
ncbi:DUF2254 domain-containing protein [Marinobacter sp.]|uniref:DUF2254 domain-containing protein n=1 Tax=Marinobacter sp. TaxID=50741 RepID=UPI0034A0153B